MDGIPPHQPDPGACPGSCNRHYREAWDAYRQAWAAYDPGDPKQSRPEPPATDFGCWHGGPVWCSVCTSEIRRKLAELDRQAALLAMQADGHRDQGGQGERVTTGSSAPASPSPAHDDLDELTSMLTGWEDAYRDLMGWETSPVRGDLATVQTETIAWLSQHLGGSQGILATQLAAEFGQEVLRWQRGMQARTKSGVRTLRKPVRCPACSQLTLVLTEGDDDIYCQDQDCARIFTRDQYDAIVEAAVKAA